MAAPQRVVEQFKASASGPGPESVGPDSDTAVVQDNPNAMAITPPWHIRHARMLITGVGVLVTLGLAYASYHVWRIQNDPVDRILAARARPAAVAGSDRADGVAAVPAAAPPPVIAAPAAVSPSAGLQQPRAAAAPFSGRPRVTHTQREDAEPGRPSVALPGAAIDAAASSPGSQACPEGVVALGLCPVKAAGK